MTVVYVAGFLGSTLGDSGDWATGPLRERLAEAGFDVAVDAAVDYPVMHGSLPDEDGLAAGGTAVVDRLNGLPEDECLALVGFSAGVVAIQKALSPGAGLHPGVGRRILVVELFGDPKNLPGILAGVSNHDVGAEYRGRTVSRCDEGNLVCDPGQREQLIRACRMFNGPGGCLAHVAKAILSRLHELYGGEAKEAAVEAACRVLGARCHTVQSGDTLWGIAGSLEGMATTWRAVYDANRSAIEKTARQHGLASSDSGHWIFPGTDLVVPSAGLTGR